ncbi:FMN-dependent oxidoreductase, nitrilotriacetate monooxygenase family [Frankia sp. EI5c]|uniref:NtaA/DmoA family FMN-dependent monooxygenase n=1 Tax=Frankia sp. EI5c TaxID=683316 RepID=UPI0007C28AF9|nr:NtaA/DmoA family FMN-dependent monooxygenase [Frankia sp. EI5c]OAA29521.1 FMN-dependent oxidoreductase, nitrilotriacetate monooxygenase family [Frankia sp. EI5c]
MFHMGWFVGSGFSVQSWRGTWGGSGAREWMKPDLYVDVARSLERACFDYMIFEDGLMIPDAFQGNMQAYLKYNMECPRHDPTALIGILGQATSRIGLIPTISTSFYPPFMAARMLATLDHLTEGRVGGNLVTSSSHRAAQNFGYEKHFEHDLRYRMADEWIDLVGKLWESWEPGAVVFDEETGTFADHTKVHTVDFEGEFFRCRGPLNAVPGPQGRPVICQAGGSPAGREFAARNADTVICVPLGVEAMKAYREDMSARLIANGRKPSDCKVLYLIRPVLGATDEEAQEKRRRIRAAQHTDDAVATQLAVMSYFSGLDFSQFDLDKPLPDLTGQVNGHQSSMSRYAKDSEDGKTLRELASTHETTVSLELVGTPDTVAAKMGEAMEEVGGDGFLISNELDRRGIAEIADGLAPALKRRGLIRESYTHEHFRDNLLEF